MSRYYTRAAVNRGIRAGVVVAGLGLGSWYVLNSGNPKWLFSPTLKAACFVQEPVTGIRIRFDTVRGSLGSGKLDFSGLDVAWKKKGWIPQKAECDLHFERMAVDVGAANADMLLRDTELFVKRLESQGERKAFVVNRLAARGVTGQYAALIRRPETPPPNICFGSLVLQQVSVQLADQHQRPTKLVFPELKVDSFSASQLRLQDPIPALLLRADGKGELGGTPWLLEHEKRLEARMPVQWLTQFLQPPLSWFQSGSAGLEVALAPGKSASTMECRVKLAVRDGQVEPADEESSLFAGGAAAVAGRLSRREVAVAARAELEREGMADGKRFLAEINEKFGAALLKEGVVSSVNALAEQAKKSSGWFS